MKLIILFLIFAYSNFACCLEKEEHVIELGLPETITEPPCGESFYDPEQNLIVGASDACRTRSFGSDRHQAKLLERIALSMEQYTKNSKEKDKEEADSTKLTNRITGITAIGGLLISIVSIILTYYH